jgi:hypothetical protein
MQIQAMLLSVQKTVVDRNIYAKAFIALPADNEKDAVTSVMQLGIQEDKADEVFRSVIDSGLRLGELVNVDVTIVRGAQNSVKQVVTGISSAQRPGHQQNQHARPAEQQKQEQK